MAPRIWQKWLPQDIAQGIQDEEPGRFAALSRCVCAEVDAILRDDVDPNRWHRLVKWLSHVNTFSNRHQDFPAEHVLPLAEALWRSVSESWRDLEAQVRITECLTKLLRTHKRTLRRAHLQLPWRPLFAVLKRLHGLPLPKLEGVGLIMARGTALVKLVSKARRFFEPNALGEVWCELRPSILAVDRRPSEGYEALGYLQLFAPTHGMCRCNWQLSTAGCWSVLNWQPHLPHIFASLTGFFDVPIGTSRAVGDIITRSTPGRASVLFGDQMGYGSFHAARLVVHLLRCTADPQRGPPTAAAAAAAASHLEHLTSLLEQYYHPSNTGKWCRDLGTLLKHLVKAAVKQLERQQPPPPQPPLAAATAADGRMACNDDEDVHGGNDDDDELADHEFELLQLEGGGDGGQGSPAVAAVAATGVASSRPWVSELREAELQRLASCCVTLAARAQFSKDSGISTVSVKALSQLALVAPGRVLPLVLERFRTALATATATHQLVAATTTLALCVRPLLLAGWAAGGESEGEERETAAQLVSEALTAVLPGFDANDEPKTNAVLQLYVSAISSLPRLRGAGEGDETDEAAAAEEAEEHSFGRAVQPAGGTGSTAAAVAPMGVDAAAAAAAANSGAAAGGSSGGVGGELTLSLYVEEWAEEVLERCLALLQNLDSGPGQGGTDMASRGGGSAASTSSFLTRGCLASRALALADRFLEVNSLVLQEEAATLGAVVVMTLPRYWMDPHLPWLRPAGHPESVPLVPGRGVELWVDKFGTGYQPPRWLGPSSEHLALANQLIRLRLLRPAQRLRALMRGAQTTTATTTTASAASAATTTAGTGGGVDGGGVVAKLHVRGELLKLAEALVDICSALGSSGDPELLAVASRCAGVLLTAGSIEHAAQVDERGQKATDDTQSDVPAATRLMAESWTSSAPLVWRRRMPPWLVQARLQNQLVSRSADAAFRSAAWCTTRHPQMTRLEQRFPCLAPVYLPYFLATLADVPYDWAPTTPLSPPPLTDFCASVRAAAFGGGSTAVAASGAAAGALACIFSPPPLSEIDRDGKVVGACHTMNKALNFWRLISRSPTWLGATLAALLAARTHNASVPQKALGDLLLTFAGRFLHPPALSYADSGGVNGGLYGDLVRSLVEVARPGAMARRGAPFRYTIIANVMLTLMLPYRYGASADVSDYGGAGGTFLPLCVVVEYGAPLPQLKDVLRATIASASASASASTSTVAGAEPPPGASGAPSSGCGGAAGGGDGGDSGSGSVWGFRLIHALALNHTELDSAEALKDKRGAGLLALHQRVLRMTFEELAGGLASVPLERLSKWPNDGLPTPAAVMEGLFAVRHARLVQLLAAAAPEEMLSALRGHIELLTAAGHVTATGGEGGDKAEMATAAEVLAGLIASGAPWVAADGGTAGGAGSSGAGAGGGVGGGWAVAALARAISGTNLDMSETWALSYRYVVQQCSTPFATSYIFSSCIRILKGIPYTGIPTHPPALVRLYAVRGILDGLVPEGPSAAADRRPLLPRPPLAAGLTDGTLVTALGDLLRLTVPSPLAPPPVTAAASTLAAEADVNAAAGGSTAVTASGGGGGGGMPARIKRLRCVGAVVRELTRLDPCNELPLPVRLFWRGLLDELHSVSSSLDCLGLRDQLRGPITDTLAYFGATTDEVEVEVELDGAGSSGGVAGAVMLLVRPGGSQLPSYHASLQDLRTRARNLALTVAARFNDAAVQAQDARAAEANTMAAAVAPPPASPRASPGVATAAAASDSPVSRAATDDLVLVDAVDVVSVPASASASETTSPGGGAAAGLATAAEPMDVDTVAAAAGGGAGASSASAAVAHLGLGLEVQLDAAARHRSPGLRELVVGMLPGLLRLQDVAAAAMVQQLFYTSGGYTL
ncbi:hypothetical protein VOLCADRAFT_92605 [Volvox carteri f. nagariensis]|uniref:Proteasome activator Blm10 middle HEAT repeats region domain-containing protein n=1 Tax=Volvox carteri f. nagariensis TaxID=3068 RepID=D8U031_VOLCA|nr:uncharacterized protein VOLCADRAFT_92605 [Volvox carteri f. nagariensis]EFJ46867.1 hypothetical protein VOLCADRAFT_92605 [Volvox carteri f. nagariensis]|eukprot:XP_002952076.1 hypothetical protein VOLCADRAFT_92605 [Volvox carteri f. nagariensis]